MLDEDFSDNDNYFTRIICKQSKALHERLMAESLADTWHKYENETNFFQSIAKNRREVLFRQQYFCKEVGHYIYPIEISRHHSAYLYYKKQDDMTKPLEIVKITESRKKSD